MFDDQTLVLSELVSYEMIYEWFDVATRTRTRIAVPPGLATWHVSDPATGRELLQIERSGVPDLTMLAHRGRSEVTRIDVPGLRRIAFTGPDLVAGTATGELLVIGDHAPPRTVHRFDAAVDILVTNDTWIAAMASSGMLARLDRATGALDTARPPFAVAWIVLTRTGDVYLAADRELYRWRGRGYDRIATLPSAIATLGENEDHGSVVVYTQQHAVYVVDPALPETTRVTQLFFRSERPPSFGGSTRLMIVEPSGGETTMFDLAHGTRWRLPYGTHVDSLSPSGRLALLFFDGRLSLAHIDVPDDPAKLRAWVLEATNHRLDAAGP
jgi:hypothetical protein